VASVVDLDAEVTAVARELVTLLHDSSGTHSVAFHQKVVLPLRRDVHKGRMPRPALVAMLGDLPQRISLLTEWLALREELDHRRRRMAGLYESALAAERRVLAELCAAEPVRRAAALTGRDLLYGVDRVAASGDAPDRKGRKSEPTVLRFALRAVSKTSPLSWYTWVGWGTWTPEVDVTRIGGAPVAYTRVNQALLARITAALVGDPARRIAIPHRLAPALDERNGRVFYRRDVYAGTDTRANICHEQAVDLPASGPLRFVLDTVRAAGPKGINPVAVVDILACRLAGRSADVEKFVHRLLDIGLLVPVTPIDPQDPDGADALAEWLRAQGDHELCDQIHELHCRTKNFGTVDGVDRPAVLAGLERSWRVVCERVGADLGDVPPLREDVVLPEPIEVGADLGQRAGATLSRLMPLLMLFDRHLLIRRLVRDQFVDRFGIGGTCSPTDYAELMQTRFETGLTIRPGAASAEVDALLAGRAQLVDLAMAGADADREIPDAVVDAAGGLLPRWAASRPVSYSMFVQPLDGGELVVNQVYAGFGQFPSRFLDMLPARARATVAARLDRTFGGAGFVQFRPVGGFNANLHPMLTDREIGEDARWADLTPESIEARHDPERDEVRLRHRASGEEIDVLYLGYLMPRSLPDRMAPLYADLACGWVDLSALRPEVIRDDDVAVAGRLRHRDVVLGRRSWEFAADVLREGFTGDESGCVLAAAGLLARHGLPQHVFVGAGGRVRSRADFESRLGAPKPQYVDLANALHLRCLPRLLSRYDRRIRLTEALPAPAGRVIELIAETYWSPS
jgi:hypothetical protein